MRLIKNTISLLHPQGLYHLSQANEHDTEGDIEEMGERLAEDVRAFLKDWCPGSPPEPSLGRLRLIVRSALPLRRDSFPGLRGRDPVRAGLPGCVRKARTESRRNAGTTCRSRRRRSRRDRALNECGEWRWEGADVKCRWETSNARVAGTWHKC